MKKGNKVVLTAVERQDLDQFMQWRNLEEFKKHFREYREINADMQSKWYEQTVVNDKSTMMFSIRSVADGALVGCCGLCYVNWVQRYAELSLYIGANESYIDNEGYAKESCELLFDYGFNQLGLNKIWVEYYEFDSKKKQLFEQLHLHVDGVLRDHYFYDGKWWNSVVLSLLAEEFRQNTKPAR